MNMLVLAMFLLVTLDLSRGHSEIQSCKDLRQTDRTCRDDPTWNSSCLAPCGVGVANHHYLCGEDQVETPCSEECCEGLCGDECVGTEAEELDLERLIMHGGPATRAVTPTFWFGTPCQPHYGPGKMWAVYKHVNPDDGICFYKRECCCHPLKGFGSGSPPHANQHRSSCHYIQRRMTSFLWVYSCAFHEEPEWLGDDV